jgi:glycosyltransferase involved in cell wall biosynthesis
LDAPVAGFHQRIDDRIFSPVPLEAFARMGRENEYFVIMGGGTRYVAQAQSLGLANFRHVRHSADPARISVFLNTLDIFAHGRRDGETFGYVFAEALLHGKPCLGHSAECNAHRETMGPGGLWATTPKEYATHLRRLLDDPALRRRLAEAGRRYACSRFDNAKGIAAIAQKYREILAMPWWKVTVIKASRYTRKILKNFGLYKLIKRGFRLYRRSLRMRGKFC